MHLGKRLGGDGVYLSYRQPPLPFTGCGPRNEEMTGENGTGRSIQGFAEPLNEKLQLFRIMLEGLARQAHEFAGSEELPFENPGKNRDLEFGGFVAGRDADDPAGVGPPHFRHHTDREAVQERLQGPPTPPMIVVSGDEKDGNLPAFHLHQGIVDDLLRRSRWGYVIEDVAAHEHGIHHLAFCDINDLGEHFSGFVES